MRTLPAARFARGAVSIALLAAVFALAASTGCQSTPRGELVPFTDEMRERYELDEAEIRGLQFYLSDRIILERVAAKGEGRVDAGRLLVRSGTVIHQIVVERGTPGAAEASADIGDSRDGHFIEVSFEVGAPLRFSAATPGGTYTLVDPVQRGSWAELLASFGTNRRLVVDFAGSRWPVIEGSSALLMIERSALGKLLRTRRVLPGVKVEAR